jgi:hypothetical protein
MAFPINISFCTVQCTNKTHKVKHIYNITYLGTEDKGTKFKTLTAGNATHLGKSKLIFKINSVTHKKAKLNLKHKLHAVTSATCNN